MATLTPVLDAWMDARDILDLYEQYRRELPEFNVLEDHLEQAKRAAKERTACGCHALNEPDARFCKACGAPIEPSRRGVVRLTGFSWGGDRASLYDDAVKTIAKKVHGWVDIIDLGHGHSEPSGVRIVGGVLTECRVVMTLEPR